jgi:hypothetical protein
MSKIALNLGVAALMLLSGGARAYGQLLFPFYEEDGHHFFTCSTGAVSTTATVTTPSVNCAGASMFVIGVASQSTAAHGAFTPTYSDSLGNSYTNIPFASADGGDGRGAAYIGCGTATSASSSMTFTASVPAADAPISISVIGVSGFPQCSVDQNTSQTSIVVQSTTCPLGPATTTAPGEIMVATINQNNAGSGGCCTAPTLASGVGLTGGTTSYTHAGVSGATWGVAIAYYLQILAGAIQQQWSWTGNAFNNCGFVTFK